MRDLHEVICQMLAGYDWRTVLASGSPKAFREATLGAVNHLRDPALLRGRAGLDGQVRRRGPTRPGTADPG